jgi:hypothetical protein
MEYHKEIAVNILKIIVRFPTDVILRPETFKRQGSLTHFIPEQLHNQYTAEDILTHLYIVSRSGLIFPQIKIEELREFVKDNIIDNANFWDEVLPKYLANYTLTVQGYEYLEEHQ